MKTKTPAYEVKVGQFWTPNDPKQNGRIIKVFHLEGKYAHVVSWWKSDPPEKLPRRTKILLNRFTAKADGYRPIPDPRREVAA